MDSARLDLPHRGEKFVLEMVMSQRSEMNRPSVEAVSSLVDGELSATEVARACEQWRDDPAVRADWHLYHLIGDVLRSEDLASRPGRDEAFLASLSQKLAAEPVVLAPASVAAAVGGVQPHPAWRTWRTPAAVMAGFAVVASVLVVTRMPSDASQGATGGTVLARGGGASGATAVVSLPSADALRASAVSAFGNAGDGPVTLNGELVRDARLDEYLAAHKKFGGSSGPGVPSGFLRNAAAADR